MKIFYYNEPLSATDHISLSAEESQHAVKVLRCQKGEEVMVLNGKGQAAVAAILRPDARACTMTVKEVRVQPLPRPHIHIALALLKKRDRIEWFVEKAVEMGAGAITLFTSGHTEKKGFDKARLEKIAISALKQSGNTWLPDIQALPDLSQLISQTNILQRFIGYCQTDETQLLKYQMQAGQDTIILIGPEGDFTPEEVSMAEAHGFISTSLGPLRLRAETAALTALMTVQIVNQ